MNADTGLGDLLSRAAAALRLGVAASPSRFYAVAALAVLEGAAGPALAWTTKLLLDVVFGPAGPDRAGRAAGLVVLLAVIALVTAGQQSLQAYLGPVLGRAIRLAVADRLFARVNDYPGLERFEDPAFRDRLQLAEQAGDHAPAQLVTTALHALRGLVQLSGYTAVLVAVWPPVAVCALLAAVPAVLVHLRLGRARAQTTADLSGGVRRRFFYRSLLTEPQAAKEVRLFGLGPFLHGRLLRDLLTANAAEDALSRRTLRLAMSLDLLGGLVTAGATAVAVWQALTGALTVGGITAFLAAVAGVQAAAVAITAVAGELYESLLLFGAYHRIVDEPRETSPAHLRLPPLREGIEFRDVWFRYRDDGPWVLRGLTLRIGHGEAVGLVGRNGAGKSTVVKLLCRMYRPQRGTIRWDGVDLADVEPDALRARIGAVFQDFMAYDLTAAENIEVGDLGQAGDRAAVRHAAGLAGIDDELAMLPRGYDTLLSRLFVPDDGLADGVAMLSGGQWQRVAAARGFLRHRADLLILDEPSAGLDAEAEHTLHLRLRRLRAGRTSLLVSHRLGALREADRIVVLDGGRVAEAGTHDTLVAEDGVYARLFALQAAGYRDQARAAVPAGD
ncbi:ABC transporter ATP-binding protein [Catellatospora citrea]|uniref:ABC transporter ATP-binding protein n=1 Tax=Catellatospora citrea TaxID=53366 RepID=UPI00340B7537